VFPHWLSCCGGSSAELLSAVAADVRAAGHPCEIVSVSSTPGRTSTPSAPGVTEARPGTYVYFDASQVRLGSASLNQRARTVLTRVGQPPGWSCGTVNMPGSRTGSAKPRPPGCGTSPVGPSTRTKSGSKSS
jgi:D-serine deaminase-like pyridoxal phosphate-dependent protein